MLAPMLADQIDEKLIHLYVNDPLWSVTQKVDGDRLMVIKTHEGHVLLNRLGAISKHVLSNHLIQDLQQLTSGWWFDGELVDGHYYVFDCVSSPTVSLDTPYDDRYATLRALFYTWQPNGATILPQVSTHAEKARLIRKLYENHAEGVIFRHQKSSYQFGIRSINMLKYKFWKDCDVILFNIGRENKRSASMAVWDSENLREIGAVKLTDRQLETLTDGHVATVKYLYATEDGRLYQPSILRLRDDKKTNECVFTQLQTTNKEIVQL